MIANGDDEVIERARGGLIDHQGPESVLIDAPAQVEEGEVRGRHRFPPARQERPAGRHDVAELVQQQELQGGGAGVLVRHGDSRRQRKAGAAERQVFLPRGPGIGRARVHQVHVEQHDAAEDAAVR